MGSTAKHDGDGDRLGPVRTVVFDLGNVLIRWDPHPAIAAAVGPDEATRFLTSDDFDFQTWNQEQDAGRPWAVAEAAVAESHPHWREHAVGYRENFAHSLLGQIDDTVTVLRDLHTAGVPVFALTNWSGELFHHAMERFDFLALFDDIVVSGDERVAKPAPEIFTLLETRTGHPLTDCVFIDDSPRNIEAARHAGLDAILFTDTGHLRDDLRARRLPV